MHERSCSEATSMTADQDSDRDPRIIRASPPRHDTLPSPMSPEASAHEELLTLIESVLTEDPWDGPCPRPAGIDRILPQGWLQEAHVASRSPWDLELAAARAHENVCASPCSFIADPALPPKRLPPRDRRATEIDWRRNLTASET